MLAFLTRRPALFAIPKASSPDHDNENSGGGEIALDVGDIEQIDAAFPRGARPR